MENKNRGVVLIKLTQNKNYDVNINNMYGKICKNFEEIIAYLKETKERYKNINFNVSIGIGCEQITSRNNLIKIFTILNK